jgi:hypothetical protein
MDGANIVLWEVWHNCAFHWVGTPRDDVPFMEAPDPRVVAARALSTIESGLSAFRDTEQRYPESLEELFGKMPHLRRCIGRIDVISDPWGERYVYSTSAHGYELYAMGPDRSPKTPDDVVSGWAPDNCTAVSSGGGPRGCRLFEHRSKQNGSIEDQSKLGTCGWAGGTDPNAPKWPCEETAATTRLGETAGVGPGVSRGAGTSFTCGCSMVGVQGRIGK